MGASPSSISTSRSKSAMERSVNDTILDVLMRTRFPAGVRHTMSRVSLPARKSSARS